MANTSKFLNFINNFDALILSDCSSSLSSSTSASTTTTTTTAATPPKSTIQLAYSSAMSKPICLCIIWVHLQASVSADEASIEKVAIHYLWRIHYNHYLSITRAWSFLVNKNEQKYCPKWYADAFRYNTLKFDAINVSVLGKSSWSSPCILLSSYR